MTTDKKILSLSLHDDNIIEMALPPALEDTATSEESSVERRRRERRRKTTTKTKNRTAQRRKSRSLSPERRELLKLLPGKTRSRSLSPSGHRRNVESDEARHESTPRRTKRTVKRKKSRSLSPKGSSRQVTPPPRRSLSPWADRSSRATSHKPGSNGESRRSRPRARASVESRSASENRTPSRQRTSLEKKDDKRTSHSTRTATGKRPLYRKRSASMSAADGKRMQASMSSAKPVRTRSSSLTIATRKTSNTHSKKERRSGGISPHSDRSASESRSPGKASKKSSSRKPREKKRDPSSSRGSSKPRSSTRSPAPTSRRLKDSSSPRREKPRPLSPFISSKLHQSLSQLNFNPSLDQQSMMYRSLNFLDDSSLSSATRRESKGGDSLSISLLDQNSAPAKRESKGDNKTSARRRERSRPKKKRSASADARNGMDNSISQFDLGSPTKRESKGDSKGKSAKRRERSRPRKERASWDATNNDMNGSISQFDLDRPRNSLDSSTSNRDHKRDRANRKHRTGNKHLHQSLPQFDSNALDSLISSKRHSPRRLRQGVDLVRSSETSQMDASIQGMTPRLRHRQRQQSNSVGIQALVRRADSFDDKQSEEDNESVHSDSIPDSLVKAASEEEATAKGHKNGKSKNKNRTSTFQFLKESMNMLGKREDKLRESTATTKSERPFYGPNLPEPESSILASA